MGTSSMSSISIVSEARFVNPQGRWSSDRSTFKFNVRPVITIEK